MCMNFSVICAYLFLFGSQSCQWFSDLPPEELVKREIVVPHIQVGLGWGPKAYVLNNFSRDADAAGPGTIV